MIRRRRKNGDAVKVQLFPFLAVLICTMGSLILVLLVLARHGHARQSAAVVPEQVAEKTEPKRETPVASPRTLLTADEEQQVRQSLEDIEWRASELRAQRDRAMQSLGDARNALAGIEEGSHQARQTLAELTRLRQRIESGDGSTKARENYRGQLQALYAKIATAQDELEKVQQRNKAQAPAYAVLPFATRTGTRRRPIYIECVDRRVILQPEGVTLTEEDFLGPDGPGNPLAAALRATREHLAAEVKEGAPYSEPYPLILVRPDGIEMYYAARQAIASWGHEFGYELIEQDWKLDMPKPDAALATEQTRAVLAARKRLEYLAQAAPRMFQGGGAPRYYRAAPGGGGIIADDGSYFGGDDGTGPRRGAPRGGPGGGRALAGVSPGGATLADGNGQGNSSATGNALDGRSPDGAGPGGRGPLTGGPEVVNNEFANGTGTGIGRESTSGTGTGTGRPGGISSGQPANTAGGPASGTPRGAADGRGLAGGGTAGSSGADATPSGASSNTNGSAFDTTGERTRGAGSPGGSLSAQGTANPDGSANFEISQQRPATGANQKSLARIRGKDWAIPESARGSTPLTRPVRVTVSDREIRIRSDDRDVPDRVVALRGQTAEAIDPFVNQLRGHIERWGISGQGFYWHPILRVDVLEGGESRFNEMQSLLESSGLSIQRRTTPAGR